MALGLTGFSALFAGALYLAFAGFAHRGESAVPPDYSLRVSNAAPGASIKVTSPEASSTIDNGGVKKFTNCGHVRVNCVVDGDTIWLAGEKIRIADFDTPEISHPHCAHELELGMIATRRLAEILNEVPFDLQSSDRDQDVYGRKLRLIMRNGQSIGERLVAEGLAHRWLGHKEPWC